MIQKSNRGLNCQLVALRPKAADYTVSDIGKKRMMPKLLALKNVGQMHFDEWNAGRQQGISQCHTCVRESSRIDEDKLDLIGERFLHKIHKLMFGIALPGIQLVTCFRGNARNVLIDLIKCRTAIMLGLSSAEQIQVGTVQNQNFRHIVMQSS